MDMMQNLYFSFTRFFVRILMFCSRGIFRYLANTTNTQQYRRLASIVTTSKTRGERIHIVYVAPRLLAMHFLFRANDGRAIELQLSQFELIFASFSVSRLLQSPSVCRANRKYPTIIIIFEYSCLK